MTNPSTNLPHTTAPGVLRCQRDAFSLDDDVHYLNCAYMGPLPRRSASAGIVGVRAKEHPWEIQPDDFFRNSDEVRRLFGRLIGAAADRVAILPAVSYGVAIAAKNLKVGSGDEIVLVGEQFPGNVYSWRRLAAETGARVITVARPVNAENPSMVGAEWNQKVLEAVGPRTRVVSMAPLHWTDGTRFDLKIIGARAREVNAAFIVDATQAAGGTPIDVREIGADLLVTGAYKWLLGPYSAALAFVGSRFDDGVPLEEGWITRKGSQDFKGLVDYTDEYAPGAIRYDVGERSNFALMPVTKSSLEHLLEWEVGRIEDYIARLSEPLIRTARECGFHLEEDAWRSRHLFGLGMPDGLDIVALKERLDAARIYISLRGNALRISPNVYNTEEDVAALCEVLREVT